MRRFRSRSLFAVLNLPGALFAFGCASKSPDTGPVGSVNVGLEISPGNTVSQATYVISGPDGFTSAGTVAVGDQPDVPVTVSGLPVGTGYEMDLDATASDGVTTCEGSATFDVTSGAPATVMVHLACGVPSGDLSVSGTFNICPMLDSVGASPGEVRVGGSVALSSLAHDADDGPAPLSYKWAVNGVALRTSAHDISFACSSLGMLSFTVTASDGDPDPTCADKLSVAVRCSP